MERSLFDVEAEREIVRTQAHIVLDIGGGLNGSCFLTKDNLNCWLLDPYIKGCPLWMKGNLSWGKALRAKFDMIIARGSFNYLSQAQIKLVPSMLNDNGIFLFNTFYKPKSGSREYINSKSSTCGFKSFEYDVNKNIINHKLEPSNKDYIIEHSFFVYNTEQIISTLKANKVQFKLLGSNSLFVKMTHT